jgi:hypothetical protein
MLYGDTRGNVFDEHPDAGPREMLPFPDDRAYVVMESPEGWTFTDETLGPNCDSKDDRDGDNEGTPGMRVTATGSGTPADPYTFDPPFTDNAATDLEMGVVGLFYLTNFAHDYFYELGFDEAAGNFQVDNFGRGGLGGDWVFSDAQDGAGVCNANFVPAPDGVPGRMQMFVWHGEVNCSTSAPARDGSLDGDIVIHEYAHGVSTRLVGGRDDVLCVSGTQSGAMGEGWSDYFPGSVYDDPELAEFATFDNLINGGLRTQPMDAPLNRYTYEDLCTIWQGPMGPGCEVHDDGEIWAQTLWDMREVLIGIHGQDDGADISDRLVLAGMKFTPCNPTFLDARDGILAADRALYNGANECAIWEAFGRGGMGTGATSTGDGDQTPVEDFTLPSYCVDAGIVRLDRATYMSQDEIVVTVTDAGAPGPVQVTLTTDAGDTETVDIPGSPPSFVSAPFPFAVGAVVPGDGTLQAAAEGETITATYSDSGGGMRQATATVDSSVAVRITRTDVISESCDDDTLPGFPLLPRFLDSNESGVLRVQFTNDTPGKVLEDVSIQLTTTHPAITISPDAVIFVGDLEPSQGSISAQEVVLDFALEVGDLTAQPQTADFSLNVTVPGALSVAGDTFTLELNLDYELVQDTMTEDFETGAAGWFHMPGAPPDDEWHMTGCNANGGASSYHNGGTGCTDYSDDQDNPYLASAEIPLPGARAFRIARMEFWHDVDLGTNRDLGFPLDFDVIVLLVRNAPIAIDLDDPMSLLFGSLAMYADLPEFSDFAGIDLDNNTNGLWEMQELFPATETTQGLDAGQPIHLVWLLLPDASELMGFPPCQPPFCQNAVGGGYYVDDLVLEYEYVHTVPQAAACTPGDCALALNVDQRFVGPACPGDAVTLDASNSGAVNCPSGVEYVWRDELGGELHRGDTYLFSPTSTEEVFVEATCLDDAGCTDSRPVKVIVPCDIQAETTATVVPPDLCPGDPVTLDGSDSFFEDCPGGAMEYRWSGPSGPLGPFSGDPTATDNVPSSGMVPYTLEVQRQGDPSCFATDTIDVPVSDGNPSGSIANALRVTIDRGSGAMTLDWTLGPLVPDEYSVHRSDDASVLGLATATPATEIDHLTGAGETAADTPPAHQPDQPVFFYRVFGVNLCDGSYASP